MKKLQQHDVLIIGSGAAGLCAALNLPNHYRVALISKTDLAESCTLYAQGGIAAVMGEKDSIESHIEDTIKFGAALCNTEVVRYTAENANTGVDW